MGVGEEGGRKVKYLGGRGEGERKVRGGRYQGGKEGEEGTGEVQRREGWGGRYRDRYGGGTGRRLAAGRPPQPTRSSGSQSRLLTSSLFNFFLI